MRIGLVGRADATGLGVQTHEFFLHMKPEKTLVVNLEHCNGRPTDPSIYPGCTVLHYVPYPETDLSRPPDPQTKAQIDDFLNDVDLVFTCETPYDYYLFTEAHRRGVKTVLQYNFELLDYMLDPNLPKPDLLMAPSLWNYDKVNFENKVFLPVPVNTAKFPAREWNSPVISEFLHIGGNPAMEDRNGTRAVMDAWSLVPNARLIVTTPANNFRSNNPRIEIQRGLVKDYTQLYRTGEAFVMPRKFGGLCLPLNEACALGMPTVMTDLPPQNEFLLKEGLCRASWSKTVMTKTKIDVFEPDKEHLAEVCRRLADDPELVADMRERSAEITSMISWRSMAPYYNRTFENVLDGGPVEQLFHWSF